MAACVVGLVFTAALFVSSVFFESTLARAVQDLIVERVRQELQAHSDETVSTVAARHFIETLPSGGGDIKVVDHERLKDLLHAYGEPDSPDPYRAHPNAPDKLKRSAVDWVHELRLVSTACMLLLGLAAWLLSSAAAMTDTHAHAAKIGACGAAMIEFSCAIAWCSLGTASQGHAAPASVIATCVVLVLMADALFNSFRATRTVLDFSRFWP